MIARTIEVEALFWRWWLDSGHFVVVLVDVVCFACACK